MLCKIKTCKARRGCFCTGCARFPCDRLRHLDQRYRARYGMSMLENLTNIDAHGLRNFVDAEKFNWACPGCGQTLCVHKAACLACGHKWR